MAVAFVASATNNSGASSTVSVTVAVPTSGVSAGQKMLIVTATERGITGNTLTVNGSTTGLNVVEPDRTGGSIPVGQTVAWKTLVAGDIGSNVVFGTPSAGRRSTVGLVIYSGAGDPVYVSGGGVSNNASTTTIQTPSATPTANNSMLVNLFSGTTTSSPFARTFTSTSGWTERVDASSSSSSGNAYLSIADKLLSGGAGASQTGNTFTDSGNSTQYLPGTFVIPPAAATPPNLVVSSDYNWAVIDATGSTNAAGGALTYAISPSTGTQQISTGLFIVPRSTTADTVYTVTVTESGTGGTDNTPTVTILKAGTGASSSEAELVRYNGSTFD